MLGTSLSVNDYKGQGHKFSDTSYATGRSQLSTFEVGIQGIDPPEPESEDDDLYENWVGNDNDDMEMQVTETQKNAYDATEPLVTTVPSVSVFSEEKYLGVPAEKMVVGGNDFTVESPMSETTKKQRRDMHQLHRQICLRVLNLMLTLQKVLHSNHSSKKQQLKVILIMGYLPMMRWTLLCRNNLCWRPRMMMFLQLSKGYLLFYHVKKKVVAQR